MMLPDRHPAASTYELGYYSTKVQVIARIWVFLGGRHFAAKTFMLRYWISLDFLGFSRPD
jgi:hypothetical protein